MHPGVLNPAHPLGYAGASIIGAVNATAPTPSSDPPRSVAWLGYGGLVPFVGLAVLELLRTALPFDAPGLLRAYGAAILSFVGALHWGFATAAPGLDARLRDRLFAWSVVPALMAWIALALPAPWATGLLVGGFALHALQDWRLRQHMALPGWYLPLRLRLTAVAVLSLLAVAGRGA